MNEKVVAIVQARENSTRLPMKVLMQFSNGKSVLKTMVDRARQAKTVDYVVVAIPKGDEILKTHCEMRGIPYYEGSEQDVLGRVLYAAIDHDADIVVELTADCPLIDPATIDEIVGMLDGYYDYVSNTMVRTFADGFDIQVYYVDVLDDVDGMVNDVEHRSHPGWNIWQDHVREKRKFNCKNVLAPAIDAWPDLGLTLDEQEDFNLLDQIIAHFQQKYDTNYLFSCSEIMQLVKDCGLDKVNSDVMRKIPGTNTYKGE